jgi:GNAT superfamily N-acetyltransferase
MLMTIQVRPFDPRTDYPHLATLLALASDPAPDAHALREDDTQRDAEDVWLRLMALDDDGRICGTSCVWHPAWTPDGHFWLNVVVDVAHRGQGIGLQLYAAAFDFAVIRGALRFEATVREDDQSALCFAEKRGFQVERHVFDSDLDVVSFDETPFIDALAAVLASGVTFSTFQQLASKPDAARQLYDLHRETMGDIPGWAYGFPSFEEYTKQVVNGPWLLAEGTYVARFYDDWVGLTMMQASPQPHQLSTLMTGVKRDFRGRDIALALKLLSVRYARAHNITTLSESNDSLNAPMVAINQKLGYSPRSGTFHVCKAVAAPRSPIG